MSYSYPGPPKTDPAVCPECGRSDQIGRCDARQHLGGGVWTTHRLWVCSRCNWIVATLDIPDPALPELAGVAVAETPAEPTMGD